MKLLSSIVCIVLLLGSCKKGDEKQDSFYACNLNFTDSSSKNPGHQRYQSLIDHIISKGVVGMSLSVYHSNTGMWLGAGGKADLHNNIGMKPCNQLRFGSTVKMFTATVILQLQEEGKLRLDDKLSAYLNGAPYNKIKNADNASIRQLLQHSSGINNYIQNLQFQTASLNDLLRPWGAFDLLAYSYHKKPYFSPGEDVRYSNTNYILLGLLIEKIEGKPLYQVFDEKIIHPLGLSNTLFAGKNPVPDGIVRGYIDMYSNLQVLESTYFSGWDYYTADGGLISNVYDMNAFFRALMNGKIIHSNSLQEMLEWKVPKEAASDFFPISYGLGIFRIETPNGIAYMHSGDAIGYYATMLYFPADNTTIVYAVNSNYGKIDQYISTQAAIEKILNETK